MIRLTLIIWWRHIICWAFYDQVVYNASLNISSSSEMKSILLIRIVIIVTIIIIITTIIKESITLIPYNYYRLNYRIWPLTGQTLNRDRVSKETKSPK